jgi:hypothetical protein
MYQVGQILYTIIEDKKIIVPVRIIEEVTIKNLDYEKTIYKVMLPNKKSQKVELDRFDQVFQEIDEASNFLIENAKKAIEKISYDALELEEKFFKKEETKELVPQIDDGACNNDDNKVKIDLGDGTSASINVDQIEKLSS